MNMSLPACLRPPGKINSTRSESLISMHEHVQKRENWIKIKEHNEIMSGGGCQNGKQAFIWIILHVSLEQHQNNWIFQLIQRILNLYVFYLIETWVYDIFCWEIQGEVAVAAGASDGESFKIFQMVERNFLMINKNAAADWEAKRMKIPEKKTSTTQKIQTGYRIQNGTRQNPYQFIWQLTRMRAFFLSFTFGALSVFFFFFVHRSLLMISVTTWNSQHFVYTYFVSLLLLLSAVHAVLELMRSGSTQFLPFSQVKNAVSKDVRFCISSHRTDIGVVLYDSFILRLSFPILRNVCFEILFGERNQFETARNTWVFCIHSTPFNEIHVTKLNKMWLFTICYLICHGYPIWNWNFITGVSVFFRVIREQFINLFLFFLQSHFAEFVSCNNFSTVIVCYRIEYLMARCFCSRQNKIKNKCIIWF